MRTIIYDIEEYSFKDIVSDWLSVKDLSKLHEIIRDQLPPPNKGFLDGLLEMIPAIIKQSKDPNYYFSKKSLSKSI